MIFKNRIAITILLLFPIIAMGQDLTKLNVKQPVKINGGLTATNTFYTSHGMTARRDPYYWMLSGNINFNLFGIINVPVSVQVSQQNRSYTQPFNHDGTKKSAKGLMKIEKKDNTYVLVDQVSWEEEAKGELKEVFRDGKLLIDDSLAEIRKRLK